MRQQRRLAAPQRRPGRQPAEEAALATVADSGGRRFLAAVNQAAEWAGLAPGMPLAGARAVCPGLATVVADPAADRALLQRLARLAERYTPLVGIDGTDGLALDVGGSAHLFGGEAALLATLAERFTGLGLAVTAALADTAPAAAAVARFGDAGRLIPPGETAAQLAPLPVAALGRDRATTADLVRLGLKRLGDLYPLPRAALAARFGTETLDRLDRMLGRRPAPIAPIAFPAAYRERIGFAEPIAGRAAVAAALDRALERLCHRLAADGRGGRRLRCRLHRPGAAATVVEIGTARASRSPADLARLFAERLATVAGGGTAEIEALVVEATVTEPLPPAPVAPLPGTGGAGGGDGGDGAGGGAGAERAMAALLDRLGNRLGFARILAFQPRPGHIPERAFAALPGGGGSEGGSSEGGGSEGGGWAATAPRPLRLLTRPEPLTVLARRPPGAAADPPALFRRGTTLHRVATATGPERMTWAWWRDDPDWRETVRDYWRIEDSLGRRLWLFRRITEAEAEAEAGAEAGAGGGGSGPDARPAGWFLHGIFP